MDKNSAKADSEQLVSIVLPVYNADKTIEACINSLLEQDYQAKEIIIVNDGSTDHTSHILDKIKQKQPVTVVNTKHGGLSHARNVGLFLSHSDIVAFAEADAKYSINWLSNSIYRLKKELQELVCGVFGPHYCWETDTFVLRWIETRNRIRYSQPDFNPPNGWIYLKKYLLDVGSFDESLPRAEDRDLGLRLKNLGLKILYEPKAVWYHKEPRTLYTLAKDSFRNGMKRIPFYRKYPWSFPYMKAILFSFAVGLLVYMLLGGYYGVQLALTFASIIYLGFLAKVYLLAKKARIKIGVQHILGTVLLSILEDVFDLLGIITGLLT